MMCRPPAMWVITDRGVAKYLAIYQTTGDTMTLWMTFNNSYFSEKFLAFFFLCLETKCYVTNWNENLQKFRVSQTHHQMTIMPYTRHLKTKQEITNHVRHTKTNIVQISHFYEKTGKRAITERPQMVNHLQQCPVSTVLIRFDSVWL